MTHTSSRNLEIRRACGWLATVSLLAGAMILSGAGCKGRTTPVAPTTGAATAPSPAAGGGECTSSAAAAPHKFEAGNYWKNEITILHDQHDPQACAQACVANAECKVATFVDSSTTGDYRNTCVLRSQVGERHVEESSGICSWVKP